MRRRRLHRAIGQTAGLEQLEKRTLLSTVLYRVNAGGPSISDSPIAWGADSPPSVSIYTNASESGSEIKQPAVTVDPAGTGVPASLFSSYRFDRKGTPQRWSFPVSESGQYELKLYFAESWTGAQANGIRVFDVKTEGQLALDNYDIYADVGGFTGAVKTLSVNVSDGALDVEFVKQVENPLVCALEVIRLDASTAGELGASATSLSFGSLTVGQSSQQTLTLTNLGSPGDPSIVIDSALFEGSGAGAFSEDLATPVTLTPGQSINVEVSFTPTSAGSFPAELVLNHDGVGSPRRVALSGSATDPAPQNQQPNVNAGDDQLVQFPNSAQLDGQVSDDGLPSGGTLTSTWTQFSGPGTVSFIDASDPTTSASFSVAGTYVLRLTAHDGDLSNFDDVTVTVQSADTPVLYRVNVGGPAVSDSPVGWGEDSPTSQSPYTNSTESGSEIKQPAVTVDPGTTAVPASLFSSYRFDRGGTPMIWSFPVSQSGQYELRLYFAETWTGAQANGIRVFDVLTEGDLALDNYDIYADVGGFTGAVKTLTVNVSDGALDVEFVKQVENPLLNAIEVVRVSQAGQLQASPGSLSFGTINTGGSAQQNLTVTNLGAAGDQVITITTVALEGAGAGAFTHNLTTPVTLNPGASTQITIEFAPTAATTYAAELVLGHDGVSSPLRVSLAGAGQSESPNNAAPIVNAGSDQAVTLPGTASLAGQVTDDGLPAGGTLTTLWTKVSGPGTVTFGNAASLSTTAAFSVPGTYVLQLTANDTELSGSDQLQVTASEAGTIAFGKSTLAGTALARPTSLQFGPDGKLYVAGQSGKITVYTVTRNDPNDYSVATAESISLIQTIPNHNDDGTEISGSNRMITGILVTGTAANPVIYVLSSDPRIGGGESGTDLNLDTNSGVLSRLTWTGTQWVKLDLVRGLPRSEENHHGNGMALDPTTNTLFIAYGGNTNMGATSNNFAYLPEFALSAAILSVDLDAIGNTTYDLPTLDDEDRPGVNDANDPFGGNNGKNQAIIVPGGPVQVYSPGYRNPYDVIITSTGKMYTIDNGSNAGWGDVPVDSNGNPTSAATAGDATNAPHEPGFSKPDQLHYIPGAGYYGGHPNPTRANTANTFNSSNPQSPVPVGNPIEGFFLEPGVADGALALFGASTNGLTEYISSHFGGTMLRDLLTVGFDNSVHRIKLNAAGDAVVLKEVLFNNVGSVPLDITTVGDTHPFHGTIWVADWLSNSIIVFEPSPGTGTGADDPDLDEDFDGYDNHDEIANGTNPLSAGDIPPDWDQDFESDLLDPDDDNDDIDDLDDPFAIDPNNGRATPMPVSYLWENEGVPAGGLLDMGFTGLMINGVSNYRDLFDPEQMTAGGAAGVLTVDNVSEGDATGTSNDQEYGFQFGVDVDASSPTFMAHTRLLAPFAGTTPQAGQSMGFYIGTGWQDNFIKLLIAGDGGGMLQMVSEVNDIPTSVGSQALSLPGADYIDLYLLVDPANLTVRGRYAATIGGTTGAVVEIGTTSIPLSWLSNAQFGLAVGIISTSAGPASEFAATWDFMQVTEVAPNTLWISTQQAHFGPTLVGQTGVLTVTLRNQGGPGDPPISIDSLLLSGDGAPAFEIEPASPVPMVLAPGQSTTLTLRFVASGTGEKQASLQIGHSGQGGSINLPLSGVGVVSGLLGEYYDTHTLTELKSTRIDPQVNFTDAQWGSAPPGTGVTPDDRYSERWTGYVKIDTAGNWTFTTNSNDGVRLWVNDVQLINNWTQHGATQNSATITLAPGWYPIQLEHFQLDGTVVIQLSFAGPGQNTTIIPSTHLATSGSATASNPTQLGVSAQNLNFGEIDPGEIVTLSLTLTHLGTAGDANIVIDATTISGTNAAAFSDSFDDAGNIVLAPGQSTTIQVTFSSNEAGSKSAQLDIQHSGTNSPLTVALSGSVASASSSGWSTLPSSPFAIGEVAAGVIDGKIYLVGEGTVRTLSYDIATGTWKGGLARRPYYGKDQVGHAINGKFYVFGGAATIDGVKVIWDATQIYDPITDTWTLGATMPFGSLAACSAVINGEIYLAGGVISDGAGGFITTDRLVKYNPTNNTWTELAPMPYGRNSAATGTDGSRIFVFGGRSGGDSVSNGHDTVQIYDPATNTWISSLDATGPGASLAPLPQARGGIVLAPYYNGEFYVIGGETLTGEGATADNVYNRVDIYNPQTTTWRLGSPMPTARHGISPVLWGDTIYVAGGGTKAGKSISTIFEALTVASGEGQLADATSAQNAGSSVWAIFSDTSLDSEDAEEDLLVASAVVDSVA